MSDVLGEEQDDILVAFYLNFVLPKICEVEHNLVPHVGILAQNYLVKRCVYAWVHPKSLQSYLTLCDPMDCSLPGSTVHGVFQARILEWVATSFSINRDIYHAYMFWKIQNC